MPSNARLLAETRHALAACQRELAEIAAWLDEAIAADSRPISLLQRLKNEMGDFHMLVRHCSETYDHFTRGRISKPQTLPSVVFREADDVQNADIDEIVKDETEALKLRAEAAEAERDRLRKLLDYRSQVISALQGAMNPQDCADALVGIHYPHETP